MPAHLVLPRLLMSPATFAAAVLTTVMMLPHGSGFAALPSPGADPSRDFSLSVTVDFPDDITKGPFDTERLDQVMATVQETGATRVNWMYYGSIDPSDPYRGNIWESHWATHAPATLAAIGEPLTAAVKAARARGLKIYGMLKPYNGGLSGTYPLGSKEAGSKSKIQRIGGTIQQLIPFLEAHPDMRLQREPLPAAAAGPVREIVLRKSDAGATRLTPDQVRIWVSPDNHRYRPLALVPTGRVGVEPAPREVRDYHGQILTRAGEPVTTVRLQGLSLTAPYVVLTTTFAEGLGDFRNTPVGMLTVAADGGQELPCVLATHAALWIRPRDFRTYGLEFDMGYGHLPITLDAPWTGAKGDPWKPFSGEDEFAEETLFGKGPAGGFIGFALGKNSHLAAAPCEAYPEVRALWLGWVRAMLDAGVDGVNLRISAHGTLSDEPEAYGWNPPVLAAYRERHGPGPIDRVKLAAIRGDFYSQFVEAASGLVRSRGKKLEVHLHAEAFRPDPVFGQQNGVPSGIDFQWKRWIESGWVDEVYLRTSWFEAAEDPLGAKSTVRSRLTRALADPVADDMIRTARAHGLPITLNRYIGRAAGLEEYLDDLALIARDGRFAAFDVYEFFDLAQSDPERPGLTPRAGRVAGLQERWKRLRPPAATPP
ncbi:MAG: hypothetical protein JNJ82_14045 [Opitutaceae bacterium]|nr:hypothetical protein [Opitutaceae bacterium]